MTEIRVLVIRADGESVVTYHALVRNMTDVFMHARAIVEKEEAQAQAQVYLRYEDVMELYYKEGIEGETR